VTAPEPPIQVQQVAPLQWQIAHGQAPDGTKVCVLILNQGLLAAQVTLNPYDLERLGRSLIEAAAQARTALILPAGTLSNPNGVVG